MKQIELFPEKSQSKSWFHEALEVLQFNEISGWPDRFAEQLRNRKEIKKNEFLQNFAKKCETF